mgnify:CR=1 FL=1
MWVDVFNPDRVRVQGFIEQEEGGWRTLVRAAWRTWLLALRPGVFWSKVSVERTPRPGRILLWAALLFPGVTWPAAAVATLVTVLFMPQVWDRVELLILSYWTGGLLTPSAGKVVVGCPIGVLALAASTAMIPVVFMCLPDTRWMAKVRGTHVLRAAVYSLTWLVPLVLLRAVLIVVMTICGAAATLSTTGTMDRLFTDVVRFARRIAGSWDEVSWCLFAIGGVWLGVWWACALRVGWRVRMPAAVWWSLMVPAMLGALIVFVLLRGERLFW